MNGPCDGYPHFFEHNAMHRIDDQTIECIFCGAVSIPFTPDQLAELRSRLFPTSESHVEKQNVPINYYDVIFSTDPYRIRTEEERVIVLASITLGYSAIAKLLCMTQTAVALTLFRMRQRMGVRTLPGLIQHLMRAGEIF